jgi:RES domain-containing protein
MVAATLDVTADVGICQAQDDRTRRPDLVADPKACLQWACGDRRRALWYGGSPGWNAAVAVAACPIVSWRGSVWRTHRRTRSATDSDGSLIASGRYHRGRDRFPPDQVWRALYTSLGRDVSLAEAIRWIEPGTLNRLSGLQITQLSCELSAVVDCREPSVLGLTVEDLCHDVDWHVTQEIAAAALAQGAEGILAPSATRLGDNLILFPAQLRAGSRLAEVSSVSPRLRRG